MEAKNRPLSEVLTERREYLSKEWLARTLRSYPEATTRFLNQERDAFRNPVGHTFREGLER